MGLLARPQARAPRPRRRRLSELPRGAAADVHSLRSSKHQIALDWPDVVARQIAEAEPAVFFGLAIELPVDTTIGLDKVTMRSGERRYEFARSRPRYVAAVERADIDRMARRLEDVVVALIEGAGAAAAFSGGFQEEYCSEFLEVFDDGMKTWSPGLPLPFSALDETAHLCGWHADLAADLAPTRRRGSVALWDSAILQAADPRERPTAAVPG